MFILWQETDVLNYLKNWELDVQEREGYNQCKLEKQ